MPLQMNQKAFVMQVEHMLKQVNPEAVLLEGFEAALIGYTNLWSGKSVAMYDASMIVRILIEGYKMEPQAALNYFHQNIDQNYMGDSSPLFLVKPDKKEGFQSWD